MTDISEVSDGEVSDKEDREHSDQQPRKRVRLQTTSAPVSSHTSREPFAASSLNTAGCERSPTPRWYEEDLAKTHFTFNIAYQGRTQLVYCPIDLLKLHSAVVKEHLKLDGSRAACGLEDVSPMSVRRYVQIIEEYEARRARHGSGEVDLLLPLYDAPIPGKRKRGADEPKPSAEGREIYWTVDELLAIYQLAKALGTSFIVEYIERYWTLAIEDFDDDAAMAIVALWLSSELHRLWNCTEPGDEIRQLFVETLAKGGRKIERIIEMKGEHNYPAELVSLVRHKLHEIEQNGLDENINMSDCVHSPSNRPPTLEHLQHYMPGARSGVPEIQTTDGQPTMPTITVTDASEAGPSNTPQAGTGGDESSVFNYVEGDTIDRDSLFRDDTTKDAGEAANVDSSIYQYVEGEMIDQHTLDSLFDDDGEDGAGAASIEL
jgi:hypothetical protein